MCYSINLMFSGLPNSGTFIYDSTKINKNILQSVPEKWNKTDIKGLK